LCNLLFPVRCSSENYDLVWNTQWQGTKCNPTLQFQHLNVIQVNTEHHFALQTFKSFPGLSFVDRTTHCISLPVWGQWSLFYTSSHLGEGVDLPCGVVWGQSTLPPPLILYIRGAQGRDCILVQCFSSKECPKMSCSWKAIDRDLCSKLYMPTENCILSSTVWYNKDLPLFLCTELHLRSLKKFLLLSPNSMNSNRLLLVSGMHLCLIIQHFPEVAGI
jgi:hypothetical protein